MLETILFSIFTLTVAVTGFVFGLKIGKGTPIDIKPPKIKLSEPFSPNNTKDYTPYTNEYFWRDHDKRESERVKKDIDEWLK